MTSGGADVVFPGESFFPFLGGVGFDRELMVIFFHINIDCLSQNYSNKNKFFILNCRSTIQVKSVKSSPQISDNRFL